jgi:hypothetical protein
LREGSAFVQNQGLKKCDFERIIGFTSDHAKIEQALEKVQEMSLSCKEPEDLCPDQDPFTKAIKEVADWAVAERPDSQILLVSLSEGVISAASSRGT